MYFLGSVQGEKAEYQVKHIQQVKVKQFSMARTTLFVSNKNNNKNNNKKSENNDKKYARNKKKHTATPTGDQSPREQYQKRIHYTLFFSGFFFAYLIFLLFFLILFYIEIHANLSRENRAKRNEN